MTNEQTYGSLRPTRLWIAFGLCAVLGQLLYHSLTFWILAFNPSLVLLSVLVLQAVLAVLVLRATGLHKGPVALCVVGIVIGGWGALLWFTVSLLFW